MKHAKIIRPKQVNSYEAADANTIELYILCLFLESDMSSNFQYDFFTGWITDNSSHPWTSGDISILKKENGKINIYSQLDYIEN